MRFARGVVGGVAVACAAVLAVASVTWACTTLSGSYLDNLNPNKGPAGTAVEVSGGGWGASNPGNPANPVQIRWGSPSGPVLGEAEGPKFSLVVKVPADAVARSTPYYVYAVQPPTSSQNGGVTRATPFEVTGTTTPVPDDDKDPAPAQSASGSASGGSTSASGAGGSTSGSTAGGTEEGDAAAASEATTTPDSSAANRATQGAAIPSPPGTTTRSGERSAPVVGGVSVGAVDERRGATPAPAAAGATDEDANPAVASRRSVGDALWPDNGVVGPAVPTQIPSSGPSTSPQTLGVLLLVGGMAALSGGFGLAEMRRRRSLAGGR